MRPRALFRGRNGTHRLLLLIIFIISIIAYCYYYMTGLSIELGPNKRALTDNLDEENGDLGINPPFFSGDSLVRKTAQQCSTLKISNADIDTVTTYPEFDFQPSWLRTREFWDKNFEDRYQQYINSTLHRPTLKVIIIPHSHNDPGWLKTFETYFELKTKNIINNIVTKLKQYPNMTFIWSEISYLNAWYESAHPTKQKALKKLIKEGRLEITTGGWVMPDEANTHIYSLLDQFIEGHLWLNNTLGVSPTSGWSIDPFGHGPTVPYLLEQSGITGTIIQRIHYAWKQWLALRQIEDFHWIPGWTNNKRSKLVVHNQPFDIYSIKSSCGPHPSVCLGFDFRRIPGEYTEYSAKHEPITDQNLQLKAKLLVEEYKRIGSLTAHNIILVPLGDDFRYEHDIEFDEQYVNYMKLINYINHNKDIFKIEIVFGTPKHYFDGVLERQMQFPTLKGDFFVYADIYSEGKPAYWSGYFTTRPYLKILARQVEHNLRNAEILFTLVSNQLRQINNPSMIAVQKKLEKQYEQLIKARRNLGLFQHHDAITGTSKATVMYDYGTKLFTSLYHTVRIQETALSALLRDDEDNQCQLQSENEWETYGKQPHKVKLNVSGKTKKIVLFNSLGEDRSEVVTVKTNSTNVVVFDHHRNEIIPHQVNPNIHIRPDGNHGISNDVFDVMFVAELPALSTVTFTISASSNVSPLSTVFCNMCVGDNNVQAKNFYYNNQNFVIKNMLPGDIQLENKKLKLVINRNSGFLRQVVRKMIRKRNVVEIQFGAYQSAQRHSGAYLFMPDYESPEKDVLSQYSNKNTLQDENIIIVSGPIATQITTMYLPFLSHTLRIFNTDHEVLSEAIYLESQVDFETPPKNRETELFMRIQTNIQNGDNPEMYTDQNGFQFQKRIKVNKLNIEGNYYPITTMAFIQDEEVRMTVVTDHAQGAAAYEPGRLELMLDRRMLYDDFRGMGEGVVDNKLTVYRNWLMFESTRVDATKNRHVKRDEPEAITFRQILDAEDDEEQRQFNTERVSNDEYQLPSFRANYLSRTLNYPINIFILDNDIQDHSQSNIGPYKIFVKKFPKNIHLMTLRTLTDPIYDSFPSSSALMILQKQANSCTVGVKNVSRIIKKISIDKEIKFLDLKWVDIKAMSLTGLKVEKNLKGFHEVVIEPMEIKTYKIKF